MVEFRGADLSGSVFDDVDLANATFREANLSFVTMRGVHVHRVDIQGEVTDLRINGVDVGPYVEAELDRRYPDRPLMRPTDPDGFRRAWYILGTLWAGTMTRAAQLPAPKLHESVGGEWSFVETLRHLLYATDAWVGLAVLGDPSPWHELDLPWDQMPDTEGVPRDRAARPSLATVTALRNDRRDRVQRVLDGLTDEQLASDTAPAAMPGWPAPQPFPVRKCLLTVLNEEWEHRLYAERDLDTLFA